MHNSVVFYRKPHNFSFYPIIHKKVLIFAKRSSPQGGRPFCIVRVSLLYDAFPPARKDALHRNLPVKYDEIRIVILSSRGRSGALSAIFRIARKALRRRRREQHIQLGLCFQQRPHGVRNRFRSAFSHAVPVGKYLQVSLSFTNSFKSMISLPQAGADTRPIVLSMKVCHTILRIPYKILRKT